MSKPSLNLQAPAKVNLFLNVTGLRTDGYHEVVTILQTIALADQLTLSTLPQASQPLAFTCNEPALNTPDNLVLKAAASFFKAINLPAEGILLDLQKNIPHQAGLGGGSSDAATTLTGLNQWFDYPLNQAQLLTLARKLGSDVPFFIEGGLALATGRGEHITTLKGLSKAFSLVIALKKGYGVSTPGAYQALKASQHYQNVPVAPLIEILEHEHPSVQQLNALLYNDFERVLPQQHPPIKTMLAAFQSAGIPRPMISGSGQAVFGFLPSADHTAILATLETLLPQDTYQVIVTETA